MRIAIFASGGGSNFQSIVDATEQDALQAEVALCVAGKAGIGVIDRANKHNIPVFILDGPIENQVEALLESLVSHRVDFVALAGFMRKIPHSLISAFPNRMVNIHPALLPSFGGAGMFGMHVHRAVIEAGETNSGPTVHIVDEEYDSGPIVLQEMVPVFPTDTPESLAKRVLEKEHQLYPQALQLFAENRVQVGPDRRVSIQST